VRTVAQLWGGVDGGGPVRARSRLAGHGLGAPSEWQCWSLLPTLGLADNDESIEARFGLAGAAVVHPVGSGTGVCVLATLMHCTGACGRRRL
jgi:hypothetical protein